VPRLWNGRGAPLWRDSCLHTKEKTPPPDHPTGRSEGAPTSLTGRALLRSGRLWFRCCFGDIPRPARGDLGAARATALRPEGPCCPRSRRRRDCPDPVVVRRPCADGRAAPLVALRKSAPSVSGEQSDRQPSAGASRPTCPRLASSTDADSAPTRDPSPERKMPVPTEGQIGWISARCLIGILAPAIRPVSSAEQQPSLGTEVAVGVQRERCDRPYRKVLKVLSGVDRRLVGGSRRGVTRLLRSGKAAVHPGDFAAAGSISPPDARASAR
jgi:hypothetical protein